MAIYEFNGHQPRVAERVLVTKESCVIGDVEIGCDSSVWPGAVVRGDMHSIRIGERTSVQDGCVLHITHASSYNPGGHPLLIGDDVIIGHKACLHGCTIGNEVLIGISAVVLDGAVVEDQVIIAAGALVPPGKRLRSGYMYKGSPVVESRALTEKEKSYFRYSAGNYVKLKDEYCSQGFSVC